MSLISLFRSTISTSESPQPGMPESQPQPPTIRPFRFSFSTLSIGRRLPLLIGSLLLGIIIASTWASYRGVKESALEVGRERLLSLTQQLAGQSQQSLPILLGKTLIAANDPAIRAFLRTPSSTTRPGAVAVLQQFAAAQDPSSLQVELWNANHTLALALADGSSTEPADLETEFTQCATDPFKAVGPIRVVKDAVAYAAVAAVKDDAANAIGYLVRWRRVSPAPNVRKQLADLLGSQAALYYGNSEGDILTDLEKIVPKPPGGLQSTLEVTHYTRDGNSVMALGRPISGTPWFIVVEFPDQVFLGQANRFLRRIAVIGVVLFAIGVAGAFALSRSITRPLHSLTQAASAISGGDYSHTVDIAQNDELGRLASAFNSMVVKVRDSQRDLERQVTERTARLDAAPSAMLMVNEHGRITLVNALTEQLFGYTRGELLDQPVEMLVPERYRGAHPGHRTGFFARPSTRAMGAGGDLYGRRKDGSEVPIEIGLNPIQTDEGAFVLASIIDITERKRAEERFRLVVEASPSAMIMVDEKGRIALVNTQTEQLFGYNRAELLEQPVEMLVPERYRGAHPGHRLGFFTRPSTRAMGAGRDLYGRRKDGNEVPIEIGLNPIRTDEGAFVLASIIDITERKRSEERFRQLIEHAPNGMVMVDQKGKIALVNAEIEKSFGYVREELIGQPIEKLVPPRFRANHSGYRDGFIANPSARPMGGGRDLYGLRKDGSEFPVEIGLNPLETEQGMMVLGTIVDIAERKQAEKKLRRSQEQLAGVIGSAMDAIISVDEEQRIVLFNTAAERMFLFPSEEAIGQPIGRFIPERFRAAHKEHIEDFGQTHVTRRSMAALGALYGLRADGEDFPIETSISQMESEGRKFYTVILRDITERRRSEEAFREQARILDLAPVLIRDLKGRILFWNSGSQQMYGWKPEEALEKITHTLFQTEFPRPMEEIKARLLAHGHWEGELVHTTKAGERIVVASHWVLHRDEHDKPRAILEVNNDITERKQAEERLQEQATLLHLVHTAIMVRDPNNIVTFWSRGSERLYGWSAEEALCRVTHDLFQTRFPKPLAEIETELLQQGYWEGELVHTCKDGSQITVDSRWALQHNSRRELVGILEVNNDITERKQAEREIRRLNEELEQRVTERTAQLQAANMELEAFSYSVSHDLRAPLRHINGFSKALLEDYEDKLDETGKSYLQEVRGASQEMAQLIDDVLQLARVTRSDMRQEVVNLSELARGVVAELQKRDVRRTVVVNIEEGLSTRGDRRLLRIVLSNLLENSLKFTSKRTQPKISFGEAKDNSEKSYFVRDNGAGFDMAYADKLFGAFQRLHTAGEFEGTGIGLATVQRIVHRHGGRVWAEGTVNEGATFYFTLPNFKEAGDGQQSDLTS